MVDDQQEPQGDEESLDSESAPEDENTEGVQADDRTQEDGSQEDQGESEEEMKPLDEAQQNMVNKVVGGKVGKQREAERRADAAERELADIKAKQPKAKAPEIPPMPNPDDFVGDPVGFKKANENWAEAKAEGAKFDAKLEAGEAEQTRQAEVQQQETNRRNQETLKGYSDNSNTFGIDTEQMAREAILVGDAMTRPEVAAFIVNDPHGPLITNHLANNPLELDKVAQMSTPEAAIYIATEIKPKLNGARKGTKAPKPADIIAGKGAGDKKFPLTKGATFE